MNIFVFYLPLYFLVFLRKQDDYLYFYVFTAATVSIRYATDRSQGKRELDRLEMEIISYP